MTLSTHPAASLSAALGGLIDYAGLFPPARLEMAPAVAEYAQARAGAHAWMLGRFIVPASRLGELRDALAAEQPPLPLSVIVDAPSDARAWFGAVRQILARLEALRAEPRFTIEALEVPLPRLTGERETYDGTIGQFAMLAETHGLRGLPIFVELPTGGERADLLAGAMAALGRHRLHAKLRCGGITADAFPSVDAVAAFVTAAAEAGVAFKATAGLHHPIRHVDAATGFPMHGFLNLLAAAAFVDRGDGATLRAVLAEKSASAFALDGDGLRVGDLLAGPDALREMRGARFFGYGSCSFAEPIADLTALHILPASE